MISWPGHVCLTTPALVHAARSKGFFNLSTDDVGSVLKFVINNVRYNIEFSGKKLMPSEVLDGGQGVCLEFANLAAALLRLGNHEAVFVMLGLADCSDPKSMHAWICVGARHYEPQSSKSVIPEQNGKYCPAIAYSSNTIWYNKDYNSTAMPGMSSKHWEQFLKTGESRGALEHSRL
mmetsp:Transcript_85917/g.223934  ORF Transcript_85917/g.223934 Transcript_85917/m.223934 type:complete len:177 (+) Transcript_85917:59-589(+)